MNPATIIITLAAVASASAYSLDGHHGAVSSISWTGPIGGHHHGDFGLGGRVGLATVGLGPVAVTNAVVAPAAVAVGNVRPVGVVHSASPVVANTLAAPYVNTVAALNSGAISDANTAGIRLSNSISAAGSAAINDANNLARQIQQQAQTNRDGAIQGAVDQARHINQLNSIISAHAVNLRSHAAQNSANQAAIHGKSSHHNTAAQLNAINHGAIRDSYLNQAAGINHVASINHGGLAAAHNQAGAVLGGHGLVAGGWGAERALH